MKYFFGAMTGIAACMTTIIPPMIGATIVFFFITLDFILLEHREKLQGK